MQHARCECPSATLQRTLKRRRSSTYEASKVFSVTSANSAFSAALPVAAICSSCKPTLLCRAGRGFGCVAAAAHSRYGGRDPFIVGAQAAYAAPDRLIGQGHTDKCVWACTLRAHAYVPKRLAPVADGMQHARRSIHTPAIPFVADDAQSMSCSELQRWVRRS
jgi:hypothetical protein